MLTRMHLARIAAWALASSCLSITTSYAAEGQPSLAQTSPDVEMSTISGEAANPRRHYRLRDPEALDPERAAEIYTIVREALRAGYPLSGLQVARDYQGWRRYNSAPYLSATHGNHYLNNYANERALAYGEFEGAGRLPVGSFLPVMSVATIPGWRSATAISRSARSCARLTPMALTAALDMR